MQVPLLRVPAAGAGQREGDADRGRRRRPGKERTFERDGASLIEEGPVGDDVVSCVGRDSMKWSPVGAGNASCVRQGSQTRRQGCRRSE